MHTDPHTSPMPATPKPSKRGILDWIELVGNKLPEPALIFVILAALVIAIGALGSALGWKVDRVQPRVVMVEATEADGTPQIDEKGKPVMVPKRDAKGDPVVELATVGTSISPRSLLTSDGIYWMFSSMLRNFTGLPALGLIFVAMLGIGLAEKFGFFGAAMRYLAAITPKKLLTPAIVLLGANSSVASDAGYIILPPLAAALYLAVGRHPIAGLAAAFAGVAGGFGGGFFPTGGDGALTGFAQDAARVIDPHYSLTILHNAYFKAGSAIVVMLAGWLVTDLLVEPRLQRNLPVAKLGNDISAATEMALTGKEKRALGVSVLAMIGLLGVFGAMIVVPGMPLHGAGQPTLNTGRVLVSHPVSIEAPLPVDPAQPDARAPLPPKAAAASGSDVLAREPLVVTETSDRGSLLDGPAARWSHAIVPMIFLAFLIPGMIYGRITGQLCSQKDFIDGIYHGIKAIVPVLAIGFFMAQFVNYFAYTRLDQMLAYAGGSLLVRADMPAPVLLTLFVLIVVLGDFALSGMLSKFGVMAPIFIPMFMMVGMSPELTTAAYRIGDSVVNIITPLNSYLLVILVVLQKYKKDAGLGSLISLMLPYSVVFFVVWTGFMLVWYVSGQPLGPNAPLGYVPSAH
jgi:aminobenzoyl-glutamate transport protein